MEGYFVMGKVGVLLTCGVEEVGRRGLDGLCYSFLFGVFRVGDG